MTHYWFVSPKHQQIARWALFTCLLAFVVILLGAYTRLTDAGLSCPDWPNCYGYLTAPHTDAQLTNAMQHYPAMPVNVKKAWTEMTHRYFAGTEGLLILILAISLFRQQTTRRLSRLVIPTLLLVLLSIQVMLGMLTVTEKLKPAIVLGHLVTGLSLLSLLWWAYLNLGARSSAVTPDRSLLPWCWLALFIVAAQVTLGGWVSTHYAGLACVDFPYCNGSLLPAMHLDQINTDLITIHMLHRFGAFITAAYLSVFAWLLWRTSSMQRFGLLLFAVIALQFTLGILNILWLRPVWLALIHHGVAVLLLLTVITILTRATFLAGGAYEH